MQEDNKRNLKFGGLGIILIFILLQIVIIIIGKYFWDAGAPGDFSVLFLFIITPLVAGICSYHLGKTRTILKWFAPFVFSAIAMVTPYKVFGVTGALEGVITIVPAIIGLIIGLVMLKLKIQNT